MEHDFQPGDIVRYRDGTGYHLRSGASAYEAAVVVNSEPLVLVSEHADMRWEHTVAPQHLERVGRASESLLRLCRTRLLT